MIPEVMYAAFRDELVKLAFGGNLNGILERMGRQTVRAPAMAGAGGAMASSLGSNLKKSVQTGLGQPLRAGARSTILPPRGAVEAAGHTPYIPLYSNPVVHHSELANTVRPPPIGLAPTMRPAAMAA
jgi:hypothetical protein